MPDTIEELYLRWQKDPDVARTVELCHALRRSSRGDLVQIVGNHASRQLDVHALLAAAELYTVKGRFDDAQEILLAAGRLAPRDGNVYRWLGEVLLRRGDAERAEKVLERAMQFGSRDPRVGTWLERARTLLPTQRSSGMIGVAAEVARAAENDPSSIAPPPLRPGPPPTSSLQTRAGGVGLDPPIRSDPALAAAAALAFAGTEPRVAPPQPPPKYAAPPIDPLLAPAPRQRTDVDGSRVPEPRDVLDALHVAGVFEPDGAVRPNAVAWEKPEPGHRRTRSIVLLVALAVVLLGGGIGTHRMITATRARQHLEAEELLAAVDADLRASDASLLAKTEERLGRAFDLESRSQHAALSWLRERAMTGLLKGGENLAFEDSNERAKDVGVEAERIAFVSVAAFLFQNDTAGAAAAIAKADQVGQNDPYFQLLAGATFERAGDPRALERYAIAAKLDPELFAAQMLLARATAVDGDPKVATERAKELRAKYPARTEGAALTALAWARDPRRGEPPPEVKEVLEKSDTLPMPLRAVPHAVRAILALEQHKLDEAKPHLQKALAAADTPGVAAWLGGIALQTGDEQLARKAALSAVSFSAVYPPARVLAARVALLGGRLDEALKAAEDLPQNSPDVAVVTAAVSYEKADSERMSRGLDAISEDARKLPFLGPLVRGQALLGSRMIASKEALAMADDDAPWADLVAMDAALDAGDLAIAEKIATMWKDDVRPLRALRLARFARYSGKHEEAERLSRAALEGGTVTLRVLAERVYSLVAAGKAHDAVAVFKTYPNVGGTTAKWLRAYAVASNGKVEEARALIGGEDAPAALAPLPARIVAATAYGALKDVRHGNDYVRDLARAGVTNPDVAGAAEKLGGKVVRRAR